MSLLRLTSSLFFSLVLTSCADPKPDGHVYIVNGLGLALPSPDLEMTFLPYNSRAEFFHDPIIEAYKYATLGLDEALLPLCDKANTIISQEEVLIASARNDLLKEGYVPETPDACMNMCSSRMSLEDQRKIEREALNQKIAQIDQQISLAKQKKSELQSSRSKKVGELGERLQKLKQKREKILGEMAEELSLKQVAKLSILVGKTKSRYNSRGRIAVALQNDSNFALAGERYRTRVVAEGYYQGVKIKDYSFEFPGYEYDQNKTDSLGFDKGYIIDSGDYVPIGNSIYISAEGLNMNTPSGRLLAQERGWAGGWVLPDEIRIVSFPASSFVIPDENGKRVGSNIVYSPKQVNFREQVADRGLPQDSEIAKLSKQINNQFFSEDDQIAALDNKLSQLRKDQQSARDTFNSSKVAENINVLVESESQCRAAGVAMNVIEKKAKLIANWKDDLSSCGSEVVDTGAIFSGINSLNLYLGTAIKLPEIDSKYQAKARQLIWAKLNAESQYITKTDIQGDFNIDGAVDQSNSLVFAPVISLSGERFWMQPLSSLKGNKNLNHKLLSGQNFSGYIDDIISYSCKDCSLEDYSLNIEIMGLAAPNPNQLANNLSESEKVYTDELASFEAAESKQDKSEVALTKVTPVQECEI
jgi:hypothetical protein